MKNRGIVSNLILSGTLVFAVSLIGCGGGGGEDQQASDEQEQSSGATTENTGGESSGGNAVVNFNEEIAIIIESVHSKEDVEKADTKLASLFDRLYDDMKEQLRDPSKAKMTEENARRKQEMDRRIAAHMKKLGTENPGAAMILGMSIAKNSAKLMGLYGEAMKVGAKDMEKAMDEMKKLSGDK